MTAGQAVVIFADVSKGYGSRRALDTVRFEIPAGQVVAVLGPNGAGKSTTLELLEGLRTPSSGRVRVLGQDPVRGDRAWRAHIGLVLQSGSLDGSATVAEWLRVVSAAYADPLPVGEVLELVALADVARRRIGVLSGGQRRRVELATALVGRPDVVFLDEPTTGLDPEARRRIWAAVESLAAGGATVLLSTHYLDEADRLADRVLVLSNGRLVADTTPADLRSHSGPATIRIARPADFPLSALAGYDATGDAIVVTTTDVATALHAVLDLAATHGLDLTTLRVEPPSLEDAYFALTGARPEMVAADV